MISVKETMEKLQALRGVGNEAELESYKMLYLVESTGLYREKDYYRGTDLGHYAKQPFRKFVRGIGGRSFQWYDSVGKIVAHRGWNKMFVSWGKTNMVVYMGATSTQKKAILAEAERLGPNANFSTIRYRLYPPTKKRVKKVPGKNEYEKRIDNLIEEAKSYKRLFDERKDQVERLKASYNDKSMTIQRMNEQINIQKSKVEKLDSALGMAQQRGLGLMGAVGEKELTIKELLLENAKKQESIDSLMQKVQEMEKTLLFTEDRSEKLKTERDKIMASYDAMKKPEKRRFLGIF